MAQRASLTVAVLLAAATASKVTPVEKVIGLISDMKKQTEEEGKKEAATYDEFCIFCKDTTMKKSQSITDGQDNIDTLSATVEDKSATRQEKITEKMERKKHQEFLSKKMDDTKAELEKSTAEYEVAAADVSKGLTSLEGTIKRIEEAQPASAAALIELQQRVINNLDMTDAVKIDLSTTKHASSVKAKRHAAITAFLQSDATVDPDDAEYHSHNEGMLKVLKELQIDFRKQKETVDSEWAKKKNMLKTAAKDITSEKASNKAAMTQIEEDVQTLLVDISQAREKLVMAASSLKDDHAYLKDLTERCEVRAKDWDQRATMRRDELAALTQALAILENKVKSADEGANTRASLLESTDEGANKRASLVESVDRAANKHALLAEFADEAVHVRASPHARPSHGSRFDKFEVDWSDLSLVQVSEAHESARGLLKRVVAKRAGARLATQERQQQVLVSKMLKTEAKRLESTTLASLAMKVAADPFGKVKDLIGKLIERLVKEATEEASKKGFCDTELGKSKHARDYRLMDVDKTSVELKGREANHDALSQAVEQGKEDLKDLDGFLKEQTKLREEEKADNMATLKEAKQGLAAVTDAITVLKVFYKGAAKASSLVQASLVDDDTAGTGFKGSYKGNQEGSKAILGLLDVIKSDFERTIKTTEATEAKNAAAFVKTDQTTKADIAGKTTQKQLDEEDLKVTSAKIDKGMEDLQSNQDLLDKALVEIEELKPACIDSGMSYTDRVKKREEEMAALKKAMCMLDPDGVEADCS